MTHRDGLPRFSVSGLWRCGASRSVRDAVRMPWKAAVAVAYAARRRASKSFDDAPHRLHLSSCPTSRLRDLYEP